jgi:hypothetical protein
LENTKFTNLFQQFSTAPFLKNISRGIHIQKFLHVYSRVFKELYSKFNEYLPLWVYFFQQGDQIFNKKRTVLNIKLSRFSQWNVIKYWWKVEQISDNLIFLMKAKRNNENKANRTKRVPIKMTDLATPLLTFFEENKNLKKNK